MKRILALTALAAVVPLHLAPNSVTVYGILDGGVSQVTGLKGGTKTLPRQRHHGRLRLGFRGNEDPGRRLPRAVHDGTPRMRSTAAASPTARCPARSCRIALVDANLLHLPSALQPAVTNVAGLLRNTVGVNLAGNMWDRQVFVGLVTPVGAVLAGRQYTRLRGLGHLRHAGHAVCAWLPGQCGVPADIDIRIPATAVAYRIAQGRSPPR